MIASKDISSDQVLFKSRYKISPLEESKDDLNLSVDIANEVVVRPN